jgi:hypothetical protein
MVLVDLPKAATTYMVIDFKNLASGTFSALKAVVAACVSGTKKLAVLLLMLVFCDLFLLVMQVSVGLL